MLGCGLRQRARLHRAIERPIRLQSRATSVEASPSEAPLERTWTTYFSDGSESTHRLSGSGRVPPSWTSHRVDGRVERQVESDLNRPLTLLLGEEATCRRRDLPTGSSDDMVDKSPGRPILAPLSSALDPPALQPFARCKRKSRRPFAPCNREAGPPHARPLPGPNQWADSRAVIKAGYNHLHGAMLRNRAAGRALREGSMDGILVHRIVSEPQGRRREDVERLSPRRSLRKHWHEGCWSATSTRRPRSARAFSARRSSSRFPRRRPSRPSSTTPTTPTPTSSSTRPRSRTSRSSRRPTT